MTVPAGLNKETRFVCFGAGIVDFDNDGYPDILLTSGSVYPRGCQRLRQLSRTQPQPALPQPGRRHVRGDGRGGRPRHQCASHCGRGAAFGDFDNDGDMDVLIMNVNEPPSLLRNDAPPGNHWIKIRLEGTKSNRSALGARVLVHYGGKVQVQEL